jgi:hypothetical protein
MIDINSLKPTINIRPPKIIIYGKSKIGKSTFGSQAPNPIILDLENGMESIYVAKHKAKTFVQVVEFMRALYTQQHDFKYLVVDSIDWLERIMVDQLCSQYNARTLNDKNCKAFSYGGGERLLLTMWNQFINGLDFLHQEKNMGIILIAHNQIRKFDDPLTESYDQHSIKLEKRSSERLKEWVDCILFASQKVKIEEEKQGFGSVVNRGKDMGRIIYTEGRPSFEAGNRFKLPPEIEFSWKSFYSYFNKYQESLSKISVSVDKNNLIDERQVANIKSLVTPEKLYKILKDYNLTKIEEMNVTDYNKEYDNLRSELTVDLDNKEEKQVV